MNCPHCGKSIQNKLLIANLTKQQSSVLNLLRLGMSNADIGMTLSISERTVKAHVRHIGDALGLSKPISRLAIINAVESDDINTDKLKVLNAREVQIALLVCSGMHSQEIANVLGYKSQWGHASVKNVLKTVYDKIGCSSRLELRTMLIPIKTLKTEYYMESYNGIATKSM